MLLRTFSVPSGLRAPSSSSHKMFSNIPKYVLTGRTGHGDPCPTLSYLFLLLEDGARRPPSYFKLPFLVAGGRGTETTVLLFRYSFWLLLFGGKYTKAAEDVCPRPLYWFAVCCFSLLFSVCFLHFLFYCSVQRFTPIRR